MLSNLYISNFILIDKLDLDFDHGFSVITGETGAGKSIILNAIGALLGDRVSQSSVRPGAMSSVISGDFSLNPVVCKTLQDLEIAVDDNGDDSDYFTIKRTIAKDGKSKAYINDHPVSVSTLKSIAPSLVEIHGQFDQLISSSSHREALDRYAGILGDVSGLRKLYQQWKELEKELSDLEKKIDDGVQNKEYLENLLAELQELDPKKGEEEELIAKRNLIANQVKIAKYVASSESLVDSIKSSTWELSSNIEKLSEFVPEKVAAVKQAAERMEIELNEVAAEISIVSRDIEAQPDELEEIEQRLYDLRAMARRHRLLVDDLEGLVEKVEKDLSLINNAQEEILNLKTKIKKARDLYEEKADALYEKRKVAAVALEDAVNKELCDLKLEKARIFVKFTELSEQSWGEYGKQAIEFYVQTNAGLAAGPLAKIASGGERSRIMLALKVVLASSMDVSTLIFDEIDSGVGGAVAIAIGKKLRSIAGNQGKQLFAITHSPQVASYADHHFYISKSAVNVNDNSDNDDKNTQADKDNTDVITRTKVEKLSKEDSKREIARMLSGDDLSDEAMAAAEKLIQSVA